MTASVDGGARSSGADRYEGGFRDGEREGQGVWSGAGGDRYEGGVPRQRHEGQGTSGPTATASREGSAMALPGARAS